MQIKVGQLALYADQLVRIVAIHRTNPWITAQTGYRGKAEVQFLDAMPRWDSEVVYIDRLRAATPGQCEARLPGTPCNERCGEDTRPGSDLCPEHDGPDIY